MLVSKRKKIDKQLLFVLIALVVSGIAIFSSATLGLLARGEVNFKRMLLMQVLFGAGFGFLIMYAVSKIHYRFWRNISPYLFIASILLTFSVFIPHFGYSAGGATRWVQVAGISFQPAEFLKISSILFASYYLSRNFRRIKKWKYGLLPLLVFLGIIALPLLIQPDTGTFVIIAGSVGAIYFLSGAKWKDIFFLILLGIIGILLLALVRPYVLNRIKTFINPAENQLSSSYQVNQSIIAIGSGGFFGRGFGQSIHKFNYLPEPTTDSIFAVAAEEFGFFGMFILLMLFFWFAQRSLKIAVNAPDRFGAFLVVGLSLLIVLQAFLNIMAMLGIAPLTGLPLPFISRGGTAIFTMLASVGIILSVSRFSKI